MFRGSYPRIVVGGLSGDSGKTALSCGLLASFRDRGLKVSAFKKGPDYIDAAWLSLASGNPARNLDTYLMGFAAAKQSFLRNAGKDDVNVIEGNRGLFDGVDSSGTHSTAELAKLLQAPIIIIQNISKVTRTAAAAILGCMKLDEGIKIAGVVLNHVANQRHARLAKEAIEEITGIPVLGSIPKLSGKSILPSRHLGLITPDEFEQSSSFLRDVKGVIEDNVDVSKILDISQNVSPIGSDPPQADESVGQEANPTNSKVRIAYFKDESFSFYYPENLEMLEAAGAELIPISPVHDTLRDDLDALYIGGGFPEMNLANLASNREMIAAIKEMAEDGLPIYAECGGLIYLARDIEWNGKEYPLSGVLPISVRMHDKPQGHGYCEAVVDNENPFFKIGTVIKGHEFHYSRVTDCAPGVKTSFSISRGVGCFDRRDGLTYKNVFASYVHIHAISSPEWVKGMIGCAENYRDLKMKKILVDG